MDVIQRQQYLDQLNELQSFLNTNSCLEENITEWISESVQLFVRIGVPEVVIQSYLETFKLQYRIFTLDRQSVSVFSPNQIEVSLKRYGSFLQSYQRVFDYVEKFDDFKRDGSSNQGAFAFSVARSVLQRLNDEILVPRWLLTHFKSLGELDLYVSLTDLNKAFVERRDAKDISTKAISVLEQVISRIPELNKKKREKLGAKLNKLRGDKILLAKYGLTGDLVLAINSSRIIRNLKVSHVSRKGGGLDLSLSNALLSSELIVLFTKYVFASIETPAG